MRRRRDRGGLGGYPAILVWDFLNMVKGYPQPARAAA